MSIRPVKLWSILAALVTGALIGALATAKSVPDGQGGDGDWAYLGRYRGANAALAADPERIVFMGDSITEGWAKQPFIAANPHHVGRGISGQTAAQMLVRFGRDVVALHPAVVHIMAGTNDIAANSGPETDDEIKSYLTGMVDLAEVNHIPVVLATIPPARQFPWRPGIEPIERIKRINAWIRQFAAERGVVLADYWPLMADAGGGMKADFAEDGVHPNAAGYEAIRALAQASIARAMTTASAPPK